jgi:hypothetical protein
MAIPICLLLVVGPDRNESVPKRVQALFQVLARFGVYWWAVTRGREFSAMVMFAAVSNTDVDVAGR